MPINYAVIAKRNLILTEYAATTGNVSTVCQNILDKIPEGDSKLTYVYDHENGIVYLCMADETFGRRIPFAFLQDIQTKLLQAYSQDLIENAPVYGLNEFSKTLKSQMEYFSSDPAADRLSKVKGEIANVKDVMVQNIERVLERGDRIDILVGKTDNLNQTSFAFRKRSTALRRQLWWKNTRLMFMLAMSILLLIYIISASICGFPMWDYCLGGSP